MEMTEAHMRVAGMIARVELRQRFYNPSTDWLEGVYAFPLPENAAVDRMRLEVGDHVIEARIAERQAARRAYEAARAQGRRAALLETVAGVFTERREVPAEVPGPAPEPDFIARVRTAGGS